MLNRNRLRVLSVCALIAAAGVALWFLLSSSECCKNQDAKVNAAEAPKIPDGHDDISDQSEIMIPDKKNSFLPSLKNCFPEMPDSIQTPSQFIQNWKSDHPQSSETVDFIHYFFKNKDDKEMRAQLLYTYVNGRPIREFRLYQVLDDGLPDPIKINSRDKHNPSDTTLAKYIDYSSVFETQKKWVQSESASVQLEVEESNSEILEFQLRQDGRTFRCHLSDCNCLK